MHHVDVVPQVLKMFMYPFFCTSVYLGVCGLAGVVGWTTGLIKKPKVITLVYVKFQNDYGDDGLSGHRSCHDQLMFSGANGSLII